MRNVVPHETKVTVVYFNTVRTENPRYLLYKSLHGSLNSVKLAEPNNRVDEGNNSFFASFSFISVFVFPEAFVSYFIHYSNNRTNLSYEKYTLHCCIINKS